MCGIAGILSLGAGEAPREDVLAMARRLRHRGPDGEGSYFGQGIGFGHTRLAIIDLSHASDQPFSDEAAGLVLVFNGEIYNYVELRTELEGLGHRFRSQGDTEVLLRAFAQWRTGAFARLNGMFACAIWDERRQELVLARDRFGEKPLYLARTGREVLFASEMKAILAVRPELRVPNLRAVYRYIARGDLDQDTESFFAGIESLPAGHYLVLDREGRGTPRRYWLPRAAETPRRHAEAVEAFVEILGKLHRAGLLAAVDGVLEEFDEQFSAATRPELMTMVANFMMLLGTVGQVRYEPFFRAAMYAPQAVNEALERLDRKPKTLGVRELWALLHNPQVAAAVEVLVEALRALQRPRESKPAS